MISYVNLYLLSHESESKSPNTIRWHRQSLAIFSNWLIAEQQPLQPSEWHPALLRQYFVYLQSHGWSGWTVRNRASSVRAFCRWLFDEELVEANIAERVKPPKRPQLINQPFTDDEIRRLLQAAKENKRVGLRDVALLLFLFDTGVRLGELVRITESDLFVQEGIAIVVGKGSKERKVFFSKQSAQALLKYDVAKRKSSCETFFQTEEGRPLSPQGVRQLLNRLKITSGVDDVHPHKFRRTFATSYLRNGGDSLMLQRTLGHTSLAMVNHYVSLVTDDLKRTHELVSPVDRLLARERCKPPHRA
jgi:integrase/recombinase XerD